MSDACVECCDGKYRWFVANDGEVLHYKGHKHIYCLWAEPEGRGFITMVNYDGTFVLAPKKYQPVVIEAKTWAGIWDWKAKRGE